MNKDAYKFAYVEECIFFFRAADQTFFLFACSVFLNNVFMKRLQGHLLFLDHRDNQEALGDPTCDSDETSLSLLRHFESKKKFVRETIKQHHLRLF